MAATSSGGGGSASGGGGAGRRYLKLGLAGDTMLGRCVAEVIFQARDPDAPVDAERERLPFFHKAAAATKASSPLGPGESAVFDPEVVDIVRGESDLLFLNLECCISTSTQRWPNPHKPFFFRAPPAAVADLKTLGVDAVTLANNHALDYSAQGLIDTLDHLKAAGIPLTGAGRTVEEARRPVVVQRQGLRVGFIGLTDHPKEFAATNNCLGVALAELESGSVPAWVGDTIRRLKEEERCDLVVVSPHWGPNMQIVPLPYVRAAAKQLREMGADLVAGHSAHCFQGVWADGRVLFDMGDFVDDYATDDYARNDLGAFFLVWIDRVTKRPCKVEVIPLKLDFCLTRLARGNEREFIAHRFKQLCAKLGTRVYEEGGNGRLYVDLP